MTFSLRTNTHGSSAAEYGYVKRICQPKKPMFVIPMVRRGKYLAICLNGLRAVGGMKIVIARPFNNR